MLYYTKDVREIEIYLIEPPYRSAPEEGPVGVRLATPGYPIPIHPQTPLNAPVRHERHLH